MALALSAPSALAKGKKDSSGSSKKSEKKKVLVGGFDGPKAEQARKAVIAALKDDGEYDVGEASDAKPGGDDKSYAKASGGAAAVIVGSVKKGAGLTLSVHNGADGALIQDVEIKGESPAKLNKNIGDTLSVSVADALAQTKAGSAGSDDEDAPKPKPKAEKPKPKKDDDEDEDKDKDDEDKDKDKDKKSDDEDEGKSDQKSEPAASSEPGTGASPLEIDAGLRAVHRAFTYHDTPAQLFPANGYPTLLTYQLPLGPAAFIDLGIYPLAFGASKQAVDFGIVGGYELNFATRTEYQYTDANTQRNVTSEFTTRASQYYVGLAGRLAFATHQIQLVGAWGQQAFTVLGQENLPQGPVVPDVSYKFVRIGADARFRLDDLLIGFHVGTRLVTDTGGLQENWFPHTKTQSLEAGLLLGYRIAPALDVIAGLDLMRYAFNFNPIPDTANPNTQAIAGGAVDQYISGSLGLRYSLPSHAH